MSIIHPNSLAEPLVYCPAVQPVNLSLYTTNKTHSMGSSRGDISKKDHIIQKMLRGVAGSRGEGMLAWIQRSCKDESWVRASGSHCNWFPCAAKTFNTFRLPIPVVHFNILLWYHHSPFQSCQHDPNIVEYVAGLRNSERNHRTTAKKMFPSLFLTCKQRCSLTCHVLHLVRDGKSEYCEVGSEIKDMRDSSLPAGISCRLLPATDNTWNSQWPQSSLQHWSLLDNKTSKG